jgi:hypothetical protein
MAQPGTRHRSGRRAGDLAPVDIGVVKPRRRPGLLYNRTFDRLLILLVPVAWFTYSSWRPINELREDMPPQFVDVPAAASGADRAREQRLAQAYWDLARTALRARYTYGSALPTDPPPDFDVNSTTAAIQPSSAAATAGTGNGSRRKSTVVPTDASSARLRYWRKLQQVWLEPYAWQSHKEWSTAWFTGPVLRLYVNLQEFVSNRVRAI